MPTQGTYFLNTSSFATATAIYTDSALTTAASNGWYKTSSNTFRQQTGAPGSPVLSSTFTCECTTFSSSSVQSTSTLACAASLNQTYFHTGSGSTPVATNVCYSDAGQNVLGNGYYKISTAGTGTYMQITGGSGVVSAVTVCPTGNVTFSSSGIQSTVIAACTDTVDQTYYHNGTSGQPPTTGDTAWSDDGVTELANGYYKLNTNTYYQITSGDGSVVGPSNFVFGTSWTGSVSAANSSAACALSTVATTYTHNNVSGDPIVNDICYTDACKSVVLSNGFYKTTNDTVVQVSGGTGTVTSIINCAVSSYSSSSVETTLVAACGSIVDETYYHTGSGSAPLATDVCYSDQVNTVLGNGYYRVASLSQNYNITVANVGAGNKYYINGVLQTTFAISRGSTYTFNQSDSSNVSHPYRLSTTSDGTHGGGVQYTSGWTDNGGGAGTDLISTFVVPANAPDVLYYYCQYHSGMGGQINVGGTQGTYVQITGGSGVVAAIGTFALGKSYTSSSVQPSSTSACSASINQTYYHSGTASLPIATNSCYSDACKSTVLGNGYYKISSSGSGTYMQITGGSGVVASVTTCVSGLEEYDSSQTSTNSPSACFESLGTTYYHNGAPGSNPTTGDYCYTTSAGTTTLPSGWYRANNIGGDIKYNIDSFGEVTTTQFC